jgi:hypothetical protein
VTNTNLGRTVSATYATSNQTAVAPGDHAVKSGTVTFSSVAGAFGLPDGRAAPQEEGRSGRQRAEIDVAVVEDTAYEQDCYFETATRSTR